MAQRWTWRASARPKAPERVVVVAEIPLTPPRKIFWAGCSRPLTESKTGNRDRDNARQVLELFRFAGAKVLAHRKDSNGQEDWLIPTTDFHFLFFSEHPRLAHPLPLSTMALQPIYSTSIISEVEPTGDKDGYGNFAL